MREFRRRAFGADYVAIVDNMDRYLRITRNGTEDVYVEASPAGPCIRIDGRLITLRGLFPTVGAEARAAFFDWYTKKDSN